LFDKFGLTLFDDLGVFIFALRAKGGQYARLFIRLQPWHLEQECFAAESRDLLGYLLHFGSNAGQVRKDTHALLQIQRTQPLQIAPHRDALASWLGGYAVHQHAPAEWTKTRSGTGLSLDCHANQWPVRFACALRPVVYRFTSNSVISSTNSSGPAESRSSSPTRMDQANAATKAASVPIAICPSSTRSPYTCSQAEASSFISLVPPL